MATKKKTTIEATASQTFGTTNSVFPEWEHPLTVERTREFDPETEDWESFITLTQNGNKMKFSAAQWRKIEIFEEESEKMMENV